MIAVNSRDDPRHRAGQKVYPTTVSSTIAPGPGSPRRTLARDDHAEQVIIGDIVDL
jgi:hypothetical protein